MKRYRYVHILLAALLIAALLAGCGEPAPAPAPTAESAGQPTASAGQIAPPASTAEPDAEPTPEPTPTPTPEPTAEPAQEEFLTWEIEEIIPEDDSVVGRGMITYPFYQGQQADALNRLVETVVYARKAEMLQSMRRAHDDWARAQGNGAEHWDIVYTESEEWSSFRYYDAARSIDCFVLVCQDYSYAGGAHGFFGTTYLVTDYASGEQVPLSSLLRRFGTDLESAGEALIGICETMAAEDSSIDVRPDYIRDELLRDGYWYPEEDGIHVVAPVYALAPYASGEIEMILPWDQLAELPKIDSGIYDRGADTGSPALDVRCRDYTDLSMLELPVITGTDAPAAQAINDELAQLARRYYSETAENAVLWQDYLAYYTAYRCWPCTTERYLNILVTEETTMEDGYASQKKLTSWVYDREYNRRVTLTEAMLMSGYHYDDFLLLLDGGMSQCSEYSLRDVAFRMREDGRPEFYLLVWWRVEEKNADFSYSAYSCLRIDESGGLRTCGELYLIDPAELDSGFSTGPLLCQAAG